MHRWRHCALAIGVAGCADVVPVSLDTLKGRSGLAAFAGDGFGVMVAFDPEDPSSLVGPFAGPANQVSIWTYDTPLEALRISPGIIPDADLGPCPVPTPHHEYSVVDGSIQESSGQETLFAGLGLPHDFADCCPLEARCQGCLRLELEPTISVDSLAEPRFILNTPDDGVAVVFDDLEVHVARDGSVVQQNTAHIEGEAYQSPEFAYFASLDGWFRITPAQALLAVTTESQLRDEAEQLGSVPFGGPTNILGTVLREGTFYAATENRVPDGDPQSADKDSDFVIRTLSGEQAQCAYSTRGMFRRYQSAASTKGVYFAATSGDVTSVKLLDDFDSGCTGEAVVTTTVAIPFPDGARHGGILDLRANPAGEIELLTYSFGTVALYRLDEQGGHFETLMTGPPSAGGLSASLGYVGQRTFVLGEGVFAEVIPASQRLCPVFDTKGGRQFHGLAETPDWLVTAARGSAQGPGTITIARKLPDLYVAP